MSRAKGDVSTWQMLLGVWVRLELTDSLWWRCNYLSQQWKPNSLRARSPFNLRDIERSHARVAPERRRRILRALTALLLTRAFACRSKWRGCSQYNILYLIFLGNRERSLFLSQFTLGIPRKIRSIYILNNLCPRWLHVSFYTQSNPPLKMNIIAALTHA